MKASASARPPPPSPISTFPPSSPPARSPAPKPSIPAMASCRRTPNSPTSSRSTASPSSGPTPEHIRMMGDKITAKQTVKALGIPTVPGSDGEVSDADAAQDGRRDRLSGADQGHGRRRRPRHESGARTPAICPSRCPPRAPKPRPRSATTPSIWRNISRSRAISKSRSWPTAHGNVVHLGERDCSLQRRHQKVWEEAGSPALNAQERDEIGGIVHQRARPSWAISAPAPSNSSTRTAASISSR